MNYEETIDYLYNSIPMFQQVGSEAYKPGLQNTLKLDKHLGHPHKKWRAIHVAGTNGKGSCAHTLASVLQASGYKVGLYTSPHLIDFRERIRVNGSVVSREYVVRFVEENRHFFEPLHPSFFEITTAMAFAYFAEERIDVAVIEVGMGGRLDCTNIISPDLCLITGIGYDHMQHLGSTLPLIAGEKAGIIKHGVPVVVAEMPQEAFDVIAQTAAQQHAPLHRNSESLDFFDIDADALGQLHVQHKPSEVNFDFQLTGAYQQNNLKTVLTAVHLLRNGGYDITPPNCAKGCAMVCENTGLAGRWQQLNDAPRILADTGHNADAFTYIVPQLSRIMADRPGKLHMVIGMVGDKDVESVLKLLPQDALYYFTRANIRRALPAERLQQLAEKYGLHGTSHPCVSEAFKTALTRAHGQDTIYIGGSSFVVADLLQHLKEHPLKA